MGLLNAIKCLFPGTPATARAGATFLEQNRALDDIRETASGLQYRVLTPGTGARPHASDSVKVHYEGRLIDGTIFDSSYVRKEPLTFPLSGVIAGWTEGLQLMGQGAIYELFIPYNLAYGKKGSPPRIPPFSALIFKVELLDIS